MRISNWSQSSGRSWKAKVGRDAVGAPGLGVRLEAAHDEAAHFFLEVDVAVGVAHHRQIRVNAGDRPGDDIQVLGGMQRHASRRTAARTRAPIGRRRCTGPRRRCSPRVVATPVTAPSRVATPVTRVSSKIRAPRLPRALGERLRDVGRIGLAVARHPGRADEIVVAHDGPFLGRLARAEELDRDALRARHGRGAPEHRHALGRPRDGQRAALLPARGEAGFRLEAGVELGRGADQARHVGMRADLADEAGGVPGGPARQAALLDARRRRASRAPSGGKPPSNRRCRRRR